MPRHRNAREARTLPDQIEFIIGFLCDAKAESIANRFELSGLPSICLARRNRCRRALVFLFFPFPVEILEPVVLQADEILIRPESARGIVDFIRADPPDFLLTRRRGSCGRSSNVPQEYGPFRGSRLEIGKASWLSWRLRRLSKCFH